MITRTARYLLKALLALVSLGVVVFVTVVVAAAWAQRSGPDLQDWHRVVLQTEFSADKARHHASLDDYLDTENAVFEELHDTLVHRDVPGQTTALNRYLLNSPSYPGHGSENLNRSGEHPASPNRGAVLMLHGMTDGPYSNRHLVEIFHKRGFYVLNMRMPGHGTAPSGLAHIQWRDWMAAVRLGAEHARAQADAGQPFWILGYSNGGALALKYTLDQLEQGRSAPDQLVLISPMVAVSSLAWISKYFYWLGRLPWFEKSLWLDNYPEYDPHKYNSFPMNAAIQSHALTSAIYAQVLRLSGNGELSGIPPVLTFQSLVDSTVLTRSIVDNLFDLLPDNGSELVIFDLNRDAQIASLVKPDTQQLFEDLIQPDSDQYGLTVISNESDQVRRVREYHKPANSADIATRDLGLEWPRDFYSLSHVALPFPPDDMVYGYLEPSAPSRFPRIGRAQMLGENGALAVPSSLFTRARSNPFFGYLQQRLEQAIDGKN